MNKTIAALALSALVGVSWPVLADAPFIDPAANTVIAIHSDWADASLDSDRALQVALYDALGKAVSELNSSSAYGIR